MNARSMTAPSTNAPSIDADTAAARIAAAIGEPARARMLYCLMDNRARTGTELAVVGEVSPSTASVHLARLKSEGLVKVLVQGRHRYFSLEGTKVARLLESLSVLVGGERRAFEPNTPNHLRAARTCYDHIAGALGVALHDRLEAAGWLSHSYGLTPAGIRGFEALGVDVAETRAMRRRFAFPCLDWSERRSHLGGSLGASLLKLFLRKKWLSPDLDSRALRVTSLGRRELRARLGVDSFPSD
jgi:DNA-binding transcriptional ArsR family regulator